jgi:hypothetical protein
VGHGVPAAPMHGRRISRFRYRRRRPVNQRHLRGEQQPRRIIRDADQQQDEIAERLGEDDRVGFHSAHSSRDRSSSPSTTKASTALMTFKPIRRRPASSSQSPRLSLSILLSPNVFRQTV